MSAPGGQGHRGYTTTRAEWQDAWERAQQRADDLQVEVDRLRSALATVDACMEWCVNLGADEATAKSLRRGMAVAREALSRPAPNEDRG